MNSLSLFSGAGGGLLAEKYLLNWRSIGYVESNNYCQKVLTQRIKEGFLDPAPLWGNIDEFIESGAVDQYRGVTDVVSGGFPCQPFSVAGRKKGKDDSRNCWPQTIEVIRRVRPKWFFGENVPGLLNSGYFPEILRTLAEARYDVKWCVLGADQVGAPHRRRRLWIKATCQDTERSGCVVGETQEGRVQVREQREPSPRGGERISGNPPDVADSKGVRWPQRSNVDGHPPKDEQTRGWGVPDTTHSGRGSGRCIDWPTEPDVGRVAHGVASRVDRLKAIGNGQVPLVAATAWELLSGQELETTGGMRGEGEVSH